MLPARLATSGALGLRWLLAAAGQQPITSTACHGALTAATHLHTPLSCLSQQRHASNVPKRQSSFLEQKRKALAQQDATDAHGNALVTVQPSESRASLQDVAHVVQHPALIVTRPIEWGTVIFGFEQCNRYTIYDQDGQVVAHLMEDYTGLKNEIGRQVLRTRRSFTATVLSPDGTQVIFRLRRPMYLINSTMYVEDGEGNTIGEVRQRWHPIRRNYDLYLNKSQFATISGNFLAWEFELKDAQGGTLALLDRNFQGFGKELFTDAGKYVIHFGLPPDRAAQVATTTVQTRSGGQVQNAVTPMAVARTDVAVIPTVTGNQLVVARPLQLEERMIALACAISVDYDYFSQHSHSGGWLSPPIIVPLPGGGGEAVPAGTDIPSTSAPGGMSPTAGAASAGAASQDTGDSSGGFDSSSAWQPPRSGGSSSTSQQGERMPAQGDGEMHLGGDEFVPPESQSGWGSGEEMKWDLPSSEGGGGEGEGEGSAVGGILGAIWSMISGDD